jgi:hypothetical protein
MHVVLCYIATECCTIPSVYIPSYIQTGAAWLLFCSFTLFLLWPGQRD